MEHNGGHWCMSKNASQAEQQKNQLHGVEGKKTNKRLP